jgi:hypothetical protein
MACGEEHLKYGRRVLASIVDESCDIVSGEFGNVVGLVWVRFDERSERQSDAGTRVIQGCVTQIVYARKVIGD